MTTRYCLVHLYDSPGVLVEYQADMNKHRYIEEAVQKVLRERPAKDGLDTDEEYVEEALKMLNLKYKILDFYVAECS